MLLWANCDPSQDQLLHLTSRSYHHIYYRVQKFLPFYCTINLYLFVFWSFSRIWSIHIFPSSYLKKTSQFHFPFQLLSWFVFTFFTIKLSVTPFPKLSVISFWILYFHICLMEIENSETEFLQPGFSLFIIIVHKKIPSDPYIAKIKSIPGPHLTWPNTNV